MNRRHPVAVVALTVVTFTLYAYYWLYQTTEELRRASGRKELSPTADVVLTLCTFGAWGVWAVYRNARIAHELLELRGEEHTDRALAVGGFALATVFSGWAWLVSLVLVQEDLNRLADSLADEHAPYHAARRWTPADEAERSSPGPQVRVSTPSDSASSASNGARGGRARVGQVSSAGEVPGAAAVGWGGAPSAPVFVSDAPAPIVF